MPKKSEPHTFAKPPRKPNTMSAYKPPSNNAIAQHPGHVTTPAPVVTKDMVAKQKSDELARCAGYPLMFGLPRDRIMSAPHNAASRDRSAASPEARLNAERYALAARPPQEKESDYRSVDCNRQVLDPKTHRPLIETVLSDQNTIMPPRKQGTRIFPQAYRNTEVDAGEIPRAARHEMESMPASYKTNLVRTLCLLYPKFTAESRLERQKQAHTTHGLYQGQGLQHSASRRGIAEQAGKKATAEVNARPNNIRIVSLMRTAAATAP